MVHIALSKILPHCLFTLPEHHHICYRYTPECYGKLNYSQGVSWLLKQPMSSTHLKVSLGCLLGGWNEEEGENCLGSRVLFRGAIGKTPRELD